MSLSSLKYLTLVQLKNIAKNKAISFPANIRKADLLSILEENLPEDYDVLQHFSNNNTLNTDIESDSDSIRNDFDSALFDVTNDESMKTNSYINLNEYNKKNIQQFSNVSKPRFGPRFGPKSNNTVNNQNNADNFQSNDYFVDKSGKKFKQGYSIYKHSSSSTSANNTSSNISYNIEQNLLINPDNLLKNEETFSVSGYIDIINNSYGFLRKKNMIKSNDDIFVSHGIIEKYKLESGNYVEGVASIKNLKSPVLIYVENTSKNTSVLSNYNNSESIYPNRTILSENINNFSVFTRMMDIVCPIAYGQRILLIADHMSGATTIMLDLAKNIELSSKKNEVVFVSINSPSDEQNSIKNSIQGKFFGASFDTSTDEQIKVVETAIQYAKERAALGKDVIIVLDNLSQLISSYQSSNVPLLKASGVSYTQESILSAKKVFSIAKNTSKYGTITFITTLYSELNTVVDSIMMNDFINNASTVIFLDKELSENYLFPAIDFKNTFSKQINLVTNDVQYDFLVKINKIFKTISNKEAHKQFIELILKTKNNKELRKKLPQWFEIWEKLSNY